MIIKNVYKITRLHAYAQLVLCVYTGKNNDNHNFLIFKFAKMNTSQLFLNLYFQYQNERI